MTQVRSIPLVAQLGHAAVVALCPLLGAGKHLLALRFSAFDPSVIWDLAEERCLEETAVLHESYTGC